MTTQFDIHEILDMAQQIEHQGSRFYFQAAQRETSEPVRNLLLELADMELQHEQVFLAIRESSLSGDGGGRLQSEQWKAVAAIMLGNLEEDLAGRIQEGYDRGMVLRQAIAFERDMIVFFVGLKEMVPDQSHREKLDGIVREELGHLIALSSRLAVEGFITSAQPQADQPSPADLARTPQS